MNKYRVFIKFVFDGSADVIAETKAEAVRKVKEHLHCGNIEITDDDETIDYKADVKGEIVIKDSTRIKE